MRAQYLLTLEEQIDPQITALLVIDIQNDYVHENGAAGKEGRNMKRVQKIIPNINKLAKEARKVGVMVIFIKQTHSFRDALEPYVVFSVKRAGKCGIDEFKEEDFFAKEGSWGAEYYDKLLKPLSGEIEIVKNGYSAFQNTKLDLYLKVRGIKSIVCTGVTTNACVLATAIHGWLNGYYSIIAVDAVASSDSNGHECGITTHERFYGYTPKKDEIIRIWNKKEKLKI